MSVFIIPASLDCDVRLYDKASMILICEGWSCIFGGTRINDKDALAGAKHVRLAAASKLKLCILMHEPAPEYCLHLFRLLRS